MAIGVERELLCCKAAEERDGRVCTVARRELFLEGVAIVVVIDGGAAEFRDVGGETVCLACSSAGA
jgi:hypothetical protein